MAVGRVVSAFLAGTALGGVGVFAASPTRIATIIDQLQATFGSKQEITYDECMIQSMRNQQQLLYPLAEKVCARKVGRIVSVPWNDKLFEFSFHEDGTAHVNAVSTEYDVVEATFYVATKACDKAQSDDFDNGTDHMAIRPSEFVLALTGPQDAAGKERQLCFKSSNIRGKYK